MENVYFANAVLISAVMLIVWVISIPCKDVSIIDLIWGLGFVFIGWLTFVITEPNSSPSRLLLPCLTTIWGLRLSGYLALRNLGHAEDPRYAKMRAYSGEVFWIVSLYKVFLLQGVIMWIVSLPLQAGITNAKPGWHVLHFAGIALWCIGLFFETIGDWQLARFKSESANKGRVLDTGLWRYTRHPNYFGDFCVWWGLYSVSIAHGSNYWTVISPLVMTLFLMKISGVGLLEKSLKQTKPEYENYIKRTSSFFPLPPGKG